MMLDVCASSVHHREARQRATQYINVIGGSTSEGPMSVEIEDVDTKEGFEEGVTRYA